MLKSFLLAFIFLPIFIGNANAGIFYCIHEIPKFTKSENQKLVDFGIKFRPYTFKSSIRKHNKSAGRLVNNYGDNWRDTLQIKMADSDENVTLFLKYLTGNGSVDIGDKNVKLTYKRSGYITCVSTIKKLRGEGGSMVHRRITSQTYTIKGRKWNRESYVMQGSGCCFTKDTKILMQDQSQKSIAELQIGDSIKTFNRATNQLENAAIKQCLNIRHDNLYQLNFRDFKITTTADHPFLLASGWGAILPELAKKYVNNAACTQIDLQTTFNMVVNGKLVHQQLESIECLPQAQMTFTITELSQGDTFIANGLIVAVETLIAL